MVNWSNAELLGFESRNAKRQPTSNDTLHSGPESDLHEKIIQHCRQNGWIYFHGAMSERTARTLGEPDFQILMPFGTVVFVECKTATGKMSVHQTAMKHHMERLGHEMHVCRSFGEFLEACKHEAARDVGAHK